MNKIIKTNVMRILDKAKINYEVIEAPNYQFINGIEMAKYLNEPCSNCFKTIVTVAKSKEHYVFMLPVDKELDLKKCALVANEKSIEMIHQKDLLPLTGYVHGGCSPLGMKKSFSTFIDESAKNLSYIYFSGGKICLQIKMNVCDLSKVISYKFGNITYDN